MVYLPFRVSPDNLERVIDSFRVLNISGFNVTIPHKSQIIKHLDEVSQEVQLMGAVNTVKNIDGKLHGYNTDGEGFIRSLKDEGIEIRGKKVIIQMRSS
jgi:shikimate dehydrogenase